MAKRKKRGVTRQIWRPEKLPTEAGTKSYYTIGEVAKMYGVEETQLRYWEELTPLAPKRASRSGARMYTQEDLQLVGQIRYLLVEKGLTLSAIDAQLKEGSVHVELQIRDKLFAIRDKVEKLKAMVDEQLNAD